MAKHKSATEVILQTEEKSPFEVWVLRNWPKAAVIGAIIAAVILFNKTRSDAEEASRGADWNELAKPEDDLASYQQASVALAGNPIEGWARLLETQKAMSEDDLAAAASAAGSLSKLNSHMLNKVSFPVGEEGTVVKLGEQLASRIAAQEAWEKANAGVLTNPEPPADAKKVTIKTESGDIVIALYTDLAPEHSANFIKLANEDAYDGTKFHRVINRQSMQMIQGGDPNTVSGEPTTWGQGGPGYTLDQEKNGLIHDSGYISMAKPTNDVKSSGSQFFLTFGRIHHLDGQHTIFGKIVSGMDVLLDIGDDAILPPDPQTRIQDRPETPVAILDVIVAE
ncbi:MAG: cyclophilin family peptidyl-prolyl cis-trans isomerase [Planctomycetota bacterium]|jgi:cyclophilin family peptidyl-prolyl cis-trans isomerase